MIPSLDRCLSWRRLFLAAVFCFGKCLCPFTVTFLSFKFSGSLAAVLMIVFGFGVLAALAAGIAGSFFRQMAGPLLKTPFRAEIAPDGPPGLV